MNRILTPEVTDAITRVLKCGEVTHPGDEWKRVDAGVHFDHMLGHLEHATRGEIDADSGQPHLAHAITRGIMALHHVLTGGRI
jgi:hypothetical protein